MGAGEKGGPAQAKLGSMRVSKRREEPDLPRVRFGPLKQVLRTCRLRGLHSKLVNNVTKVGFKSVLPRLLQLRDSRSVVDVPGCPELAVRVRFHAAGVIVPHGRDLRLGPPAVFHLKT